MPFESPEVALEMARKGGKASGEARRQQKKLRLSDVEATLGKLDDLSDCGRWLRQISLWGAGGMLPGTVLNGCVRAVEVRLKVIEAKQTEEITASLRERLDELEAQVKRQRLGVAS